MRSFFRTLLYASFIFVFCFSATASSVTAQREFPGKPERVTLPEISLEQVEDFYGLLSQRTGPVKVVVELSSLAGLPYQASLAGQDTLQAVRAGQAQIDRIAREQNDFVQQAASAGIAVSEIYRVQRVYNGIAMVVDSQQVKALSQLRGVKAVYPLISKERDHVTSVPLINAPQVWGGTGAFQGDGIRIGIIDTGIDYLHTNFGGPGTGYAGKDFTVNEPGGGFPSAKVVGGYDFAGDNYDANGSLGSMIPSPDPDPMDCNGHGTHVAGSAAGLGVQKDGATYTGSYSHLKDITGTEYIDLFRIGPGVAPKASLYALRVFGCGGSTDLTDVAVEWAVDPNGDGDYSDRLDVINLSLGSSFGSEYDTSAMAVNNAALAGVIVVASAGNSSDFYYITGAPAVARYAISVANTVDASAIAGAFMVNSPATIGGLHVATEAEFGPNLATTGPVTGLLAAAVSPDGLGCTAFTNGAEVAGRIALIDRGACNFTVKVKNAQDAGAIGVLIANNAPGDPITMGGVDGTIVIPSMMTTQAVGNLLKANLSAPVVLTLSAAYRNTLLNVDPTQTDKLVASSSRGVRRADNGLKPDIAAPGDTIFSAATGTGSQGVSYGGTSMAAPHVAGVMALLRQEYPDWTVEELKARVMNTATHDLYVGNGQTGTTYTPSRVGAGRVDALKATSAAEVIAFNASDPGSVSLSFGFLEVVDKGPGVDVTLSKMVTVQNKGAADASYTVSFAPAASYQANPGIAFGVTTAAGTAVPDPLVVAAGSSVNLRVTLAIDASQLGRRRDMTVSAAGSRYYVTEAGGYLNLTPVAGEMLRVPVYAAPRPASDLRSTISSMPLPDDVTGMFELHLNGTGVLTADDVAKTTIFELAEISPDDAWSTGILNNADLRYVGVMADTPFYASVADMSVYFGIATYGEWTTPHEVEMDIYIDSDEDGQPDYVVFNYHMGLFSGGTSDTFLSVFCSYPVVSANQCDVWYYLNGPSVSSNTNPFNSSVMMLAASAEGIGLSGTNTDFNYAVVTYSRESADAVDTTGWLSYDIAGMVLDTNSMFTGSPMWTVQKDSKLEVYYDTDNTAVNGMPKGLLLLHHHNVTGNQAEVVLFEYEAEAIALAPDTAGINALNGTQVLMGVTLENTSQQNCTFDLSYASDLGWAVTAPAARYVPSGALDHFTVRVIIPGSAPSGLTDRVQVTAVCRENPSITAKTSFQVMALRNIYLPFIGR